MKIEQTDPEEGVWAEAHTPDGRLVHLIPLLFPEVQISVGPAGRQVYTASYLYGSLLAAAVALGAWSGEPGTEPEYWARAVVDGRPTRRRADDGTIEERE